MSTELSSTYRIQFHSGFRFSDAAALAEYLSDLGISHIYSSPYLQAAPASTHGYDIVDYHSVNQEPGGADEKMRGGELKVAALFKRFPVALLSRQEQSS